MTSAAFLGTVAFAAGAGLTTFFAPCAFPLLPGYVGYYVHQSEDETPGVVWGRQPRRSLDIST
ncbi:cytochrome C biogenesis protein transmembrane region/thiol-disulfide transporter [Candidatus Halobonum tyrrellensis G22]|uniref:Cytochrome C biogenesis protein transmembrane region/thiol-disulfide transporter n=1 Tax=Candidatus Halobonum tyrrellensis G22 TaxID=1324957 RepID=V4HG93_9EURY|nr:cytochrome C biogenesis protein transmembrane region/thiol-disulfide transporter [Candidatus Halobonum tyrrellensis G22]